MKQIITTLILVVASVLPALAQRLSTSIPVYDCGQVLYQSPVSVTFTLSNKTSKSTLINAVESSCGCTTAALSSKSIASGKDVELKVTYDARQLGHFYKEVMISEEGQDDPFIVAIKGVVVTMIKDFSGTYPYMLGQIRADRNEVEFDDVIMGGRPSEEIHILNTTGETITPVIMHLPPYIKADVSPTRLQPEQNGVVTLTLETNNLRDFGLSQTSIYLGKYAGDRISADKEISTSTILLPSYTPQDTQDENAPQLEISSTEISLSKMTGKPEKLKGEILIKNTGNSVLEISSLQMFTAGMSVALSKSKLQPSETAKLKIIANSIELKAQKSRPRILMITNSPRRPKVVITINE